MTAFSSNLSPLQSEIATPLGSSLMMMGPMVPLEFLKQNSRTLQQPNAITELDCHKAAEYVSGRIGASVVFHPETKSFYCFPSSTSFPTSPIRDPRHNPA